MPNWKFATDCTTTRNMDALEEMVDHAVDITWSTFCRFVRTENVKELFPGYNWGSDRSFGLHIKDDYAVSFHKSRFEGYPCVYIDYSHIWYIFQEVHHDSSTQH